MANHVIVGAGASGLYTAHRLLKDGNLPPGDTVQLFEWSHRPGGRIFTYEFPDDVGPDGLYCEFGGMRFATDPNFPSSTAEGHRMVQNLILELGLLPRVVPFGKSSDRLYYLRGQHVYESELTGVDELPYGFDDRFRQFLVDNKVKPPYTADNIIGAVGSLFAPGLGGSNAARSAWCNYFADGTVPASGSTASFPTGSLVRDIGYWNLLYDQLGDEGYDYVADGNGYSSNVINWSSVDAFQNNNDVGSTTDYMRLAGGYSTLFETLAERITQMAKRYPGSGIGYGQQLLSLSEPGGSEKTLCNFLNHASGDIYAVEADQLFLAMPRRALELVAARCEPGYMLNDPRVKYALESSIDQPAVKAVLVFGEAWWTSADCRYQPRLEWPTPGPQPPDAQKVGGPTVTDLPLRMIDYFANNVPGGPGPEGGPYVLLASYDDMSYASFWRELETIGDYQAPPSTIDQPLTGPTRLPVDSAFAGILLKQLADVHGIDVDKIPAPLGVFFQDWGQDPFGGGYHGWSSHYDICETMDRVRAPHQKIIEDPHRRTYVIGSCYSFDQGWVEGALSTAESVLQEFVGLPPLNANIDGYTLVCRARQP
jgi:hypothetical protein